MPSEPFNLLIGGFTICTPAWSNKCGHMDDFHRLYFPRSGQATLTAGGQTLHVTPGHVYLIPGHRQIMHVCPRRMEVEWLHFRSRDLVDQTLLDGMPCIHTWPAHEWTYWERVIAGMGVYFTEHTLDLAVAIQAMLMDKVGQLLVTLHNQQTRNDPQGVIERLNPAIAFMDAHALDNPSLQAIATTVHLSPSHFHRMFQTTFRLSPHQYMLRQRMTMAVKLLRTGRWQVSEVAIRCGYDNLFYFSRVFKKYHGIAPIEARKGNLPTMP